LQWQPIFVQQLALNKGSTHGHSLLDQRAI
jgi:hypothetical protein